SFEFTHHNFRAPVSAALRTDERGRTALGKLDEVRQVTAILGNQLRRSWTLRDAGANRGELIHARAGEVIEIPWAGAAPLNRDEVSLLEKRGDANLTDHFEALSLTDGALRITGLAPGDYRLALDDTDERTNITIKVSAGAPILGWLAANARILE